MNPVARLDHAHVWHPFTQMRDWLRREPIVLVDGRGATVRDLHGRRYLDANASIWTNLHGHRHPQMDAAVRAQLRKVAHTSALGLANEPASRLAARLVALANPPRRDPSPAPPLRKVFYSDDGSTGMEAALKLAYEFRRRIHGPRPAPRFLSLGGAYHGDTIGAVSLGHIDRFHAAFRGLIFRTDRAMAPFCYRCPHNRAKPERADARTHRQCRWECVDSVGRQLERANRAGRPYAAFVFEPRLQGAAGMVPQPEGWLPRVAEMVRSHGAQLIADEVMTGFGRTNAGQDPHLFASVGAGVQPDYLVVAKGLTGGYLPMAATLTTDAVFNAFLGEYSEFKSFFHGHSYTANPLGAAAALASIGLLTAPGARPGRDRLARAFADALAPLWESPWVGDIRREGLVAGIELVRDWRRRTPFAPAEQVGIRVTEAMARRGVLTRPVGDVLVLMPPYCTTVRELQRMAGVMREAIDEVLGAAG